MLAMTPEELDQPLETSAPGLLALSDPSAATAPDALGHSADLDTMVSVAKDSYILKGWVRIGVLVSALGVVVGGDGLCLALVWWTLFCFAKRYLCTAALSCHSFLDGAQRWLPRLQRKCLRADTFWLTAGRVHSASVLLTLAVAE